MDEAEFRSAVENNMNFEEGHLGGYIRSNSRPAPSGLRIEHGDPATYSPELWKWAFEKLGVRSVLDVGCGEGHCAAYFKELGCRVRGVDGSKQAKRDSVIPDHHVVHDFVDGRYEPEDEFDLVWSCEFVEHVEEKYRDHFLTTFSASKRYLMMTYASPGQPGWHHVNCQPESYWVEALQGIGFTMDELLTAEAREAASGGHFSHRGLVFVSG